MDREKLFQKVNEITQLLYNIDDEILFEYCLECINNDDYASEENFEYLFGGVNNDTTTKSKY